MVSCLVLLLAIAGLIVLGVLFDDERATGLRRAGECDSSMPARGHNRKDV